MKTKFVGGGVWLVSPVVAMAVTLVLAGSAPATVIFKANNTTALNATGSWTGAVVPTSADIATWNSTVLSANASVALGDNSSWLGLQLGDGTNPGANITISATATKVLTLGASGVVLNPTGTSPRSLTIGADVAVSATQAWNIGGTLFLNQTGALSGAGGIVLTKTGTGALTLASLTSTYAGKYQVTGGVLGISGDLAFGPVPGAFQSDYLTLDGGSLANMTVATSSTVFGSGFDLSLDTNRGITLGAGGGTIQTGYGRTVAIAGPITGAGGLTKTDIGTLVLSGGSSYGGNTTVNSNGGTLKITGSLTSNVTVNSGSTITGSGSSTGSLSLLNNSTLLVGSSALLFNGVNATGTVNVVLAAPSPTVGTKTVDLVNYGIFLPTGIASLNISGFRNSSIFNDLFNAKLVLQYDVSLLTWDVANTNWTTAAAFAAGPITFQSGDSVIFDTADPVTLTGTLYPSAVMVNNTTGTVSMTGTGLIAGGTTVTKEGAGTFLLSTPNTYLGQTFVNAGLMQLGNANALGASGIGNETLVDAGATLDLNNQALNSATISEIIKIAGTGIGDNGALVNNSGSGQQQALNNLTLTADASVGGAQRFDIRSAAGAPSTFLDMGGFTLTKVGSNQFSIVATPVSLGSFAVNAGTLSLETTTSTAGAGTISIASTGTLGLFGNTAGSVTWPITSNGGTINNLGSSATVNSNVILAGPSTFTGSTTTTLLGVISGSGSLLKTGSGTFSFAGSNTYTGKTSVTAGTIAMTGGSPLGAVPASFVADQITLNGGTLSNLSTTGTVGVRTISANQGIVMGASGGTFNAVTSGGTGTEGFTVQSVISGTGALTKSNAGTLTLSGANTYSGGTVITGGPSITAANAAINLNHVGGLASGNISFTNTGTIIGMRFLVSPTLPNNLSFSSTAGLTNRFMVDASRTVTLGGVLSGGTATSIWQLDVNAASTLILSGNNTYLGTTKLTGGQLVVASNDTALGASTLQFSGNSTLATLSSGGARVLPNTMTIDAGITATLDSSPNSLTLSGPIGGLGNILQTTNGTVTLSGANTYSGNTTYNLGLLTLEYSLQNNSKLSDTGALTLNGSSLVLSGGSHTEIVGSTTFSGFTSIARSSGTSKIALGTITRTNGQLDIAGTGIATTTSANVNGLLPGVILNGSSLTMNDGSGNIVAFTGFTDLFRLGGVVSNDGTLSQRVVDGGVSGNVTLGAATTDSNNLVIGATGGLTTISGANTLRLGTVGSLIALPTSAGVTVSITSLTAGGPTLNAPGELILNNSQNTVPMSISSVLADNGTGAVKVSKAGTGKTVLTAINTATGGYTIAGGILQVGDGTTTGNLATLGIDAPVNALAATTLILNDRVAASSNVDCVGVISGGGAVIYNGVNGIAPNGGLSAYTVNNASTYTGGTTINNARTTATSGTAFGTGLVTVSSGGQIYVSTNSLTFANSLDLRGNGWYENAGTVQNGAIRVDGSSVVFSGAVTLSADTRIGAGTSVSPVFSGVISGANNLEINGATNVNGTVIFSGANVYSGTTKISSGTLQIGNAGTTGTLGAGAVTNNGILRFNRTNADLVSNNISGTGSVVHTGTGTTTLLGSDTYTGGTTLTAGTLSLGSSDAIGITGTISFGGGTLQFTAANTTDYSARFSVASGQVYRLDTNSQLVSLATALTAPSASLIKIGQGTLTVTNATNVLSNGITISDNGGTLLVPNTGALGTGAVTFNKGGTNTGTLALQLTGSNTLATNFSAASSTSTANGGTPNIQNVTGNTKLTGNLTVTATGGNGINVQSDAGVGNFLELAGLLGVGPAIVSGRTDTLGGAGNGLVSGVIQDSLTTPAATMGLTKEGSGTWTLTGANTYTGSTTVSGGILSLTTPYLADGSTITIATTGATLNLNYVGTDTVNQLFFGGVLQQAGTWGSPASAAAHKTTRITGTGILNVLTGAPSTPYDTWMSIYGLTYGLNDAKDQDPDNDGQNNLSEFAFDGNPLSGLNSGKIQLKVAALGPDQVLTLTLPVFTGVTFSSPDSTELVSVAAVNGVIYHIQGSAELDPFDLVVTELNPADTAAVQGTLTLPLLDAGWTYRTFRTAGTVAIDGKNFMRAKVNE